MIPNSQVQGPWLSPEVMRKHPFPPLPGPPVIPSLSLPRISKRYPLYSDCLIAHKRASDASA